MQMVSTERAAALRKKCLILAKTCSIGFRNDNPAVREAALQSRCLAYLTKPFSVASLAAKLRLASAYSSEHR